jgi:glyoxylase-like metal-dependent hydrolase (beta-lactamase superfamily II)
MPFGFGHLQIHQVRDGTIALDGGAMFGVVPRPLWERHFPPDARNRITLALRCMLVLDGTRRILVDDGIGGRWDGRHRDLYGISHDGLGLDAELARAGVTRDEITDVVLTHLHFDHAGGTTRDEGGQLRLSFPKATYHLQRRHWNWAHHASEKDRGSFRPDDFALLEKSGRLHLLEGNTELYPGVHLFVSEGHTVGLQLVRLESGDQTVVFCGDLIPTTAHLKAAWVAAYDLYPLTVIEEKKQLLAQAIEEGWHLFLEHDPVVPMCTVRDDGHGQVVVDRVEAL